MDKWKNLSTQKKFLVVAGVLAVVAVVNWLV